MTGMMDAFFDPENVFVVVGATNNGEKYGSKVFLDLKAAGYNVVAINRNARPGEGIHGTPAYRTVTEYVKRNEKIKKVSVVLVLVVPPPAALAVVEEAAEHGVRKAWFQPGAESKEATAFCDAHKIACIHDQCIMVQKPSR